MRLIKHTPIRTIPAGSRRVDQRIGLAIAIASYGTSSAAAAGGTTPATSGTTRTAGGDGDHGVVFQQHRVPYPTNGPDGRAFEDDFG